MTRAFTIKKPNIHYAWLILIACCALQAGSQGTIFDTLGVFNSPVCNDLGFEFLHICIIALESNVFCWFPGASTILHIFLCRWLRSSGTGICYYRLKESWEAFSIEPRIPSCFADGSLQRQHSL